MNYPKIKLTIITLTLLLGYNRVNGQGSSSLPSLEPISVLPVSPNTASLGNYTELPVAGYTGIQEVGVPLWQINMGDINLPISLSYHAGGIKVDEIASWIGTGWSLNAGGVISRSIRGLIDGQNFSYTKINKYVNNLMSLTEKADYLDDVLKGREDSEPDIYYLNINGINCQFYQASNGKYTTLPSGIGIKIEKSTGTGWVVTDNKGIQYTFSEIEHTESAFLGGENYSQSVTTWYISHIEDTKNNKIDFLYTPESYMYNNKGVEKVNVYDNSSGSCGGVEFVGFFSTNNISAPVLQSIQYSNTEIVFNTKSNARMDLPGGHALNNIEIKYKNLLVKRFVFFTSYFNNTTVGTSNNRYHTYSEMDKYRLRLDSVREESLTSALPSYKFGYITNIGLPYRLSNAQDDWGYYNGADNYDFVSYFQNSIPKGANKKINPLYSDQFTLNKITYPTGGDRTFEYEGNKLPASGNPVIAYQTFFQFYGDNSTHRPNDDKDEFISTTEVNFAQYKGGEPVMFNIHYTVEDEPNSDCSFDFFLLKDGETPIQLIQDQSYTVPAETYTLMARIIQPTEGPGERYPVSYHLAFSGDVIDFSAPTDAIEAPGIRIKRIINHDLSGVANTKIFDYNDPSTGKSSGIVGNTPLYKVELEKEAAYNSFCSFKQYSSQSNYPLINARSGYVGYSYVTEYYDDNGVFGKKMTRYTNFDPYTDINLNAEFPFKPYSSQSWKRGLPLTESVYERVNDNYVLRQQKIFRYQVLQNSGFLDWGVKVGALRSYAYVVPTNEIKVQVYKGDAYMISTDAFQLVSDSLIVYDNQGFLQTKNIYDYADSYFQLNKITTLTSKGLPLVTELKYPFDMTGLGDDPNGVYQNMVMRNMIFYPTEMKKTKNMTIVSKSNIDYTSFPSGHYLPHFYKSWNRIKDIDEIKLTYSVFDTHGNPLETSKSDGITTSYLWGYDSQYLIAEIIGAEFASVNMVVDTALLNDPLATEGQIRTELNKLRTNNQTKNAITKTYTYAPLIGVSSETDANGKTTFYEYDPFGRLRLVRDEDGKILKKICYNYWNQPENCDCTDFSPNWQNTATPLRCKKTGSNNNTGEQEQEQKDMNPCSPTYNQLRWIVTGTNLTACPLPPSCNSSNCSGVDQKCVYDVCETGIKVYTGSHREGPYWFCDYHYEFSDGSWSGDYSEEVPPQTECTDID